LANCAVLQLMKIPPLPTRSFIELQLLFVSNPKKHFPKKKLNRINKPIETNDIKRVFCIVFITRYYRLSFELHLPTQILYHRKNFKELKKKKIQFSLHHIYFDNSCRFFYSIGNLLFEMKTVKSFHSICTSRITLYM
jgi:hypothetical protein